MDIAKLAIELENAIKLGNMAEVRHIVDNVPTVDDVRALENAFEERDPLVCAIDLREEAIALYLVEKGFNHRLIYQYKDRSCDHWCYSKHGDDKCPTEYDALDLAERRSLLKVIEVIKTIRNGLRKPGDGLALAQYPGFKREDSAISNKRLRGLSSSERQVTAATAAKQKLHSLQQLGLIGRHGNTPLHLSEAPTMVHVCVSMGYNVNKQNFVGDSPLHVAVRKNLPDVAFALLMNGASLTIKNKLGLNPTTENKSEQMSHIFDMFKPGLPAIIEKGLQGALLRHLKLWCNPYARILKDDQSAFEVLHTLNQSSSCKPEFQACYQSMKEELKTLELVHAVLSEDIQSLKRLLRTETGWSSNKRLKDNFGAVLLSCAVEQHSLEVVQLLLESAHCSPNVRVRDVPSHQSWMGTDTVPLLFKALEPDIPVELWSYLDYQVDCYQKTEKDKDGNTAVIRALSRGASLQFMEKLLRRHGKVCLTERNKYGQNLRELAVYIGRNDIKQLVDRYIMDNICSFFVLDLPCNFYGQENLSMRTLEGASLADLAATRSSSELRGQVLHTLNNYHVIEAAGVELHEAAARGDLETVARLSGSTYRDKNGFTPLHRAIAFYQYRVVQMLVMDKPLLKCVGDNCNFYPLHYAYALPDSRGQPIIDLLLRKHPEDIEYRVDMFGREPAEIQALRDTYEVQVMLEKARIYDCYGEEAGLLAPLPV